MKQLFNMGNPVWQFLEKLMNVVWLNMLWVICCIPIITIGPSTTAMYYVLLQLVRDEEGYIVKSFFRSFRENLKQGIVITIILLAIGVLGALDFYFYLFNSQGIYLILKYLFLGMTLFYLIEVIYIFPILAKFSNTTGSLMKNALLIGIRHLPMTVLIVLIHVAVILLLIVFPAAIIFGLPLASFLSSYLFVKIFDNYIPKDEEKERFSEEEWQEIQKAEESVEHVVYTMNDGDEHVTTDQILKQREQQAQAAPAPDEEPRLSDEEKMLL